MRIVIAAPIPADQVQRIVDADERFEVINRPDLMPPLDAPRTFDGTIEWTPTDEQEAEYQQMIRSANVLLGVPRGRSWQFKAAVEENPDLQWVHTHAAGGGAQVRAAKFEPEDLARVKFTTSAGAHAKTLAEFSLLGVLAGMKDLPRLQRLQRDREWGARLPVRQVSDSTVLVVGMGNIGREVAKRFLELGAEVIGVNRSMRDVEGVEMHLIDEIELVAPRADAIINCLPGAVGTDNLISADVLTALPEGAVLVSVGRGRCIDEEKLIELLQSGHIAFAAMDVFVTEPLPQESPLWDLPNVIIAPHTMAYSATEVNRIVDIFIDNAKALIDGKPMRNVVDKELFY